MSSLIKPDFSDRKTLEKYSSAFTLSDMEIFIFPELFYPLVLADIMSPIIWKWRDDPWFRDIQKKNFVSRANRIKQFIIDNYVFNLDLETWGLTDKDRETDRFRDFFDIELLKQSNALFGYEGDRYYFTIDIRRHFGLDKYDTSVIPYWKTETIEAMTAFRHKEHFTSGAGECVSLSALYAAAMFILGGISLEKIFMMATPLHSQNYIDEKEGLLTNNRRIMTRNMWFNGTSLSGKARRALENENVTVVSHITGHIHMIYDKATIDRDHYRGFSRKLRAFVTSDLTPSVFINFLRFKSEFKCLFQYKYERSGSVCYISLDKLLEYEHSSKFSMNEETRAKLLEEVEGEEFFLEPLDDKIILNDVEKFLKIRHRSPLENIERDFFSTYNPVHTECVQKMFSEIRAFIITEPRLPSDDKVFVTESHPVIDVSDSRDRVIKKVEEASAVSEMALLALYAYRDMERIDWQPFIKAALERNPVCHAFTRGRSAGEIYSVIQHFSNKSVYDGRRMAQPDEVWNFRHGDGAEKAILMADAILHNHPESRIKIDIKDKSAVVSFDGMDYPFETSKGHTKKIDIEGKQFSVR